MIISNVNDDIKDVNGSRAITNTQGTLTVTNTNFTNNTNGGAIYNYNNTSGKTATVILNNTNFTGNQATDKGGAIYSYETVAQDTNVEITGGTFDSNQATLGGAIYNEGGIGTIQGIFLNNSATLLVQL